MTIEQRVAMPDQIITVSVNIALDRLKRSVVVVFINEKDIIYYAKLVR